MLKTQFILILAAVALIYLLYSLPRVVLNSSEKMFSSKLETNTDIAQNYTNKNNDTHVTSQKKATISRLKSALLSEKKEAPAFDTLEVLITALKSVNLYDSAAIYAAHLAEKYPKVANFQKAGNLYYEAYQLATDAQKANLLSIQARKYLEKTYQLDPSNDDAKVKIGMTYVLSSNPMQGVIMIREVLEKNPTHELAIFNLGILSLQSGQYQKAKNRFNQLLTINSSNLQALFYLGLSLKGLNEIEEAIKILQDVQEQSKDPQLLSTVIQLINEIKQQ